MKRSAVVAVAAVVLAACSGLSDPPADPQGGQSGSGNAVQTYVTTVQVLDAVKAAQGVTGLPDAVAASLTKPNKAGPVGGNRQFDCRADDVVANPSKSNPFGLCAYGDPKGTKLMVIYGDSHANMWAATLQGVAEKNGWKLKVFGRGDCPAPDLQFISTQTKALNTDCNLFHTSAVAAIRDLHPNLVIVTSDSDKVLADWSRPTATQWQDGWASTFTKLAQPGTRFAMIGSMPQWKNNDAHCLAAHVRAVQECSSAAADATPLNLDAERAAATAAGALYIPTAPWICADRCEPVIADARVFSDTYHLTMPYAVYLVGALGEALAPVFS